MEHTYFFRQLVGLLRVSVCICNMEEKTRINIGNEEEAALSEEEMTMLTEQLILEKKDYPVIGEIGENLIVAAIWNREKPEEWILVGPIIPGYAGAETFNQICKRNKVVERMGLHIQKCSLDSFASGVLLIFREMTKREMTVSELWEQNVERSKRVQGIQRRVARDIFYRQENYGPHNPYEQELRELESIKSGDVDALKKSIEETYIGEIGMLAKNLLRHHKNVAIGNITLASRAAVSGGVSVEQSFSMADSLIQQIEELDNVPEVEMFKREAKFAYARAVNEEHKQETGVEGAKNPLIAGVKDYIFSHLHNAIQIADIAEYLHVNADYLSHLFRTQEKVTIKRYILQEKIRRSQNLLRYSDYRIQEIGFYLGFSSQSHFTKTFQEIVGMTPNEYRKQFNNREKWTTI